jgi:hypothetical protein
MALGVISVAGTFYSQYQIVASAKAEAARHAMIRDGLGRCIGSGRVIMTEFGTNKTPIPIQEYSQWVGNVLAFLHLTLGDSYVERFNDVGGPWTFKANGADDQHNSYYGDAYLRLTKLEEFSHELP